MKLSEIIERNICYGMLQIGRIAIMLFASITFVSCDEKQDVTLGNDTNAKMEELKATGELSTVEYTIEKVIKAEDCSKWKLGDRKILFACKAYVEGGLDLTKYDASKTVIDEANKSIVMTLPKPTLLSLNIPAEEIALKYEKTSGLRYKFDSKERIQILQQGESDIKEDVKDMGILDDAETNATLYFTSLLKCIGYNTVTIKYE
ncbi:MAG: DUF4230 domain-containing protein [Candidatus Limisoma sp.]